VPVRDRKPGKASSGGERLPVVVVLHGPNLNLLGQREPEIYGHTTLAEIDANLVRTAAEHGVRVDCLQSNHEGVLIDRIQLARQDAQAIVINAGGLTHTSVALRDALAATDLPIVEVHLSNLARREPFRQESLISAVSIGQVAGFGDFSYTLGLQAAIQAIKKGRRIR
jgi:3-dehydroquinate dehydratase II